MDNTEIKTNPLLPMFPVEYYGSKHLNKWMDDLMGRGNVYSLIRTLYNQKDGFADTYKCYLDAIDKYREILGAEAERSIKKLMVAIDMEIGVAMFWVGIQGLKMNYQHFIDPFAGNCTFPNFNYAEFPRLELNYSLPMHKAAGKYIQQFRESIPDEYEDVWDDILDYQVALEYDGMKLAHFYGYLAGNELLRHCVPGYAPDILLTDTYKELVEKWFERPLRVDEWEGCYRMKDWVTAPIEMSDPQDDCVFREEILKDAAI